MKARGISESDVLDAMNRPIQRFLSIVVKMSFIR